MKITHADIKKSQKTLSEKITARQNELQEVARQIFYNYVDSLALPAETWIDHNGMPRAYVTTGELNDKGLFQARPIAAFQMDKEYKLNFLISTVVDDSRTNGGPHYLISVSINKEAGAYNIDIGKSKRNVVIRDPEDVKEMSLVSDAIKEVILLGFTDPRLD